MGGFAWVTLATNDSYSLGALVLAHSLKQVGTTHQLAVLVTPGVTNAMKEKLAQVFNVVQEVNILDSRDESNLKLLKRPELGITFTKLHCWRLTQFDKCVFLDADTLVLQNSDELFEREEFSAAPDVGWPDCFNSGVFVYRPSLDTFEKLIQFALEKGSFDGGDQGLLNLYFSEWAHKDISKHLPFIYNMCSTACYSYLPAFKQFGANAKIIHFIGPQKPWLSYFNTETKRVQPSSDSSHLQEVLQRWWDIFCSLIHPVLSPAMQGQSQHEVSHSHFPPQFNPPLNPTPSADDYENAYDPWDDYDKKLAHNTHIITHQSQVIDSLNTNTSRVADQSQSHLDTHYHQVQSIPPQSVQHEMLRCHSAPTVEHHFHPPEILSKPDNEEFNTSSSNQSVHHVHDNFSRNHHVPENVFQQHHSPEEHHVENLLHEQHIETPTYYVHPKYNFQNPVAPERPPSPTPSTVYTPILPKECEATTNVSNEITLTSTIEDSSEGDAGLAGAFSQLTLGVARTAEQDAVENVLRKQAWEVGNIDYLGRDSFDNIWSKIVETISSAPEVSTPQSPNDTAPAKSQSPPDLRPVQDKKADKPKISLKETTK